MAPWWTWPVVKASLTFLSMIFCIVTAAVSSAAVVADTKGGPSMGIGVFTVDMDDAMIKLANLPSKNPVDIWGQDIGNDKVRCKPFKIMWQSMQGCVIVAIIGCFGSSMCSLSLLAFKEHNGARNVVSWIVDLLALLGSVMLTALLIIVYFIVPCPETATKKSYANAESPEYNLGCGAYLAGVSVLLIFVSLFLPAKSGSKQANLNTDSYQHYNDYNAQPMQSVGSPSASSPTKNGVGYL